MHHGNLDFQDSCRKKQYFFNISCFKPLINLGLWQRSTTQPVKVEGNVTRDVAQHRTIIGTGTVAVAGTPLQFVDSIRSLGVSIDANLSFDVQVNAVCKSCNFHIQALRQKRNSLPLDVAKTVACAIIGSRLDYCNALLYNISDKNIQKLQRVQNNLACVVLKAPRLSPTEPLLVELHWLPVAQRIKYKLVTLTHIALTTGQPKYLSDLLHRHFPVRHMRSAQHELLSVPAGRTKMASRAFSHAAPTIWNSLPDSIKDKISTNSFKSGLKTFMFRSAYGVWNGGWRLWVYGSTGAI